MRIKYATDYFTTLLFLFFSICQHFHTEQYSYKASEKMKAKGLICNYDLRLMTVESIEKATEDIVKKYEGIYESIGEVSTSYPAKYEENL